jgi:hypothetical protein
MSCYFIVRTGMSYSLIYAYLFFVKEIKPLLQTSISFKWPPAPGKNFDAAQAPIPYLYYTVSQCWGSGSGDFLPPGSGSGMN